MHGHDDSRMLTPLLSGLHSIHISTSFVILLRLSWSACSSPSVVSTPTVLVFSLRSISPPSPLRVPSQRSFPILSQPLRSLSRLSVCLSVCWSLVWSLFAPLSLRVRVLSAYPISPLVDPPYRILRGFFRAFVLLCCPFSLRSEHLVRSRLVSRHLSLLLFCSSFAFLSSRSVLR